MLDRIRTTLHAIIDSPRGNTVTAVRASRMVARELNQVLGSPLCSETELSARREAAAKLASLRSRAKPAQVVREAAPVIVYFEKDRNQRLQDRIEELLRSRAIAYRALDVSGDEVTMSFVMREAKCEEDDLPVVFVASVPVGGYNELVEWDVSGKLKTSVFGV